MNKLARILAHDSRRLDTAWHLACLVLILMSAVIAANVTWQVVGLLRPVEKGAFVDLPPLAAESQKALSAANLGVDKAPEIFLFGQQVDSLEQPTVMKGPKAAPKTTLNLVLKGIISANPMSRAVAIIAEKGGKSEDEVYGVGDQLPGNARIVEIYADRIILERSGRSETLFLSEDESGPGVIKSHENIVGAGDGTNWKINADYWQERLADIPSLAREVGVDIYKEGDVQKGYKLISARGSKLLKELGLEPGDVLLEVNGVKLTSVHQGLAAYQKIRNSAEVRALVIRNGNRENRVYKIEK